MKSTKKIDIKHRNQKFDKFQLNLTVKIVNEIIGAKTKHKEKFLRSDLTRINVCSAYRGYHNLSKKLPIATFMRVPTYLISDIDN